MSRNWALVMFITTKTKELKKLKKLKAQHGKGFLRYPTVKWICLECLFLQRGGQHVHSSPHLYYHPLSSSKAGQLHMNCLLLLGLYWTPNCPGISGWFSFVQKSSRHSFSSGKGWLHSCVQNILGTVWITSTDSSPKYCLKIGPASVPRSRWHELYPVSTGDSISPRRIQGATFVYVSNSSGFKVLLYYLITHKLFNLNHVPRRRYCCHQGQ